MVERARTCLLKDLENEQCHAVLAAKRCAGQRYCALYKILHKFFATPAADAGSGVKPSEFPHFANIYP